MGYSLAFAFDLLVETVGWRWVYRIAAMPGIVVAIVLMLTVREPPRQIDKVIHVYISLVNISLPSFIFRQENITSDLIHERLLLWTLRTTLP